MKALEWTENAGEKSASTMEYTELLTCLVLSP